MASANVLKHDRNAASRLMAYKGWHLSQLLVMAHDMFLMC